MELTDKTRPDAFIDFVNSSKTVETDMNMLRRRVRALPVGLFGDELKLNLVTFPTRAFRLIGSYIGTLNDFRELVSLAKRVIIKPAISNRFKLNEESTKALQILKESKIIEEV
jgi:alcohol dehydrogenase, propanol-preferring